MPLQQTSGNVTQDAYGGGAAYVPTYVEQLFSTYLYTGQGTNVVINNGIDFADNGGLLWTKDRTTAYDHILFDTARGMGNYLATSASAQQNFAGNLGWSSGSFNTNGYTLVPGTNDSTTKNGDNFASWSFRKSTNFFDIQTWTGNGSVRNITHNLGSVPGCIFVKRLNAGGNWSVYHKGVNGGTTPEQYVLYLNTTAAQSSNSAIWNNTAPTSSVFTVGTDATVNASGGTYVAYLFGAGGTGGFGLTGTQDIIKCGNYTGNGSATGPVINLGWEPQWVLVKSTTSSAVGWYIQDSMRGMSQTNDAYLVANTTDTEGNPGSPILYPTATGFSIGASSFGWNQSGGNYIYIAIRRGPMATPTTGTSVFSPNKIGNGGGTVNVNTGFPVDLTIETENAKSTFFDTAVFDRLRGTSQSSGYYLYTDASASEMNNTGDGFDNNTLIVDNFLGTALGVTGNCTWWNFARAPGFFDIVCDTGDGTTLKAVAHNLTVVPQLMIRFERSAGNGHWVYTTTTGNTSYGLLNQNQAFTADPTSAAIWGNTTPTSSNFYVGYGTTNYSNQSGQTYVTYLFSTVSGVSKVGSYTGNGTGQSIACGFGAGGARFVLIKRTDSTGNWYVFDSANGLTSSSSPYLQWNTGSAQTTGNNGVYASSGGFTLGSTASTTTNISTASYIFLAIA